MCDPMVAGAGLLAFGTYQGAKGNMEAAEANNAALEYNAQLAELNAKNAELDAQWVEKAGAADVVRLNRKVEEFKGGQRASFGASGAVVDSGSTLKAIEDTAAAGAIDALTITRNAAKQAQGIRVQGANYQGQAALNRLGKQDPNDVFFNSLLTGGSQIGSTLLLA